MNAKGNKCGAPKGDENRLIHGVVAFRRQVKRRAKRNRSLIDKRTKAGRAAAEIRDDLTGKLKQAGKDSTSRLILVELAARDVYFLDEIDRRIFRTMYKVNQANPDQKKYGVKGLATLYGYRSGIARNLRDNLLALGLDDPLPKEKTLDEILQESTDQDQSESAEVRQ